MAYALTQIQMDDSQDQSVAKVKITAELQTLALIQMDSLANYCYLMYFHTQMDSASMICIAQAMSICLIIRLFLDLYFILFEFFCAFEVYVLCLSVFNEIAILYVNLLFVLLLCGFYQ
eukprot:753881_1